MENKMFCFQCQETAGCSGCTVSGVCGKKPDVAAMQDLLVYVTKGLSAVTTKLRTEGKEIQADVNYQIVVNLFTTITNANFDRKSIVQRIVETLEIKEKLLSGIADREKLPDAALWNGAEAEFEKKVAAVGVLSTENKDIRSLRELITYGLKGLSAYEKHAVALGYKDEEIDAFLQKALAATLDDTLSADELTALTLQREANRLFGFTAQQTLDYTQSLYEKKLVTYPRTDSQFLTEDMGQTAGNIAGVIKKNISFMQGISHEPKVEKVLNSKKVSDHHAIIPTMELAKADLDKIPGGEMQILSLIAQRLICATGEKHIYETVKAELSCNGIMFTATGKSILQNGWKTYEEQFKKSLKSGNSKAEKEETPLPQLSEGMTFEQVETKVSEHFTAPPKHFTEDTLLSAMEHAGSEQMNDEVERKGLGTPATRAAIIEKLVEKGFVERKNKQMFPTDDGIKLITVLPEVVKSPKLTAEWENDLTLIAKGEKSADTFLAGIEELVSDLVHTYHEVEENGKHMFGSDREVIGKCPKCGGNVYESKSNFYCENRACDFALFKNNKYFASMRKELNKSIAQALLNKGEAKVSGLYSQKKDSTFSAVIHMDASGKYPQFSMTFDNKKQKSNQK